MRSCRVCQERCRPMFDVAGCQIDRCGACGFVQVRDEPGADAIAAIYSDNYFQKSKYADTFTQDKENEKRLELLSGIGLGPESNVLDAGCATGDFMAFVGERFRMWGLDVSGFATQAAKEKVPAAANRIFTGFIEQQDFKSNFFDAIVMWDVLEHLWSPVDACAKIVSYLKPGGHFIVSTPDIGALTAKVMRRRWAFMTPPEHLGWFSDKSINRLFKKELGLVPVKSFTSGKWVNVGFLAHKLRRVFPAIPEAVVRGVKESPLGDRAVYVPTADIQYVAALKP